MTFTRRWGLILCVAACAGCAGRQAAERPDALVLVVVVDTLRADRLGVYGNDRQLTPNLDGLAARGIVFDHAYAASNHTRPAVASILTGLYPVRHGFWADADAHVSEPNIATALRPKGYRTININANPNTSGFRRFFDESWSEYAVPARTSPEVDAYYPAGEIVRQFWSSVERLGQPKRLLAYVQVADPHGPFTPARYDKDLFAGDPVRDAFDKVDAELLPTPDLARLTEAERQNAANRYDQEVRLLDEELGRLFDEVRRRYPQHLMVVTADHGEEFLEHGFVGHGTSMYNEQIRAPLLVYDSTGRLPGGRRSGRLASHVDILPTVVEWAGADPLEGLDGESLVPMLDDDRRWPAVIRRQPARTIRSESTYRVAAMDPDFLGKAMRGESSAIAQEGLRDPIVRAVLHRPAVRGWQRQAPVFKLLMTEGDPAVLRSIHYHAVHDAQLFNVAVDPGERHNLFDGQRALVDRLERSVPAARGELRGKPLTPAQLDRLRSLGYIR